MLLICKVYSLTNWICFHSIQLGLVNSILLSLIHHLPLATGHYFFIKNSDEMFDSFFPQFYVVGIFYFCRLIFSRLPADWQPTGRHCRLFSSIHRFFYFFTFLTHLSFSYRYQSNFKILFYFILHHCWHTVVFFFLLKKKKYI